MLKVLVVGLDGAGKTTLIKKYNKLAEKNAAEFFMSTAYINLEKVMLKGLTRECLVLDMSGQVSTKQFPNIW